MDNAGRPSGASHLAPQTAEGPPAHRSTAPEADTTRRGSGGTGTGVEGGSDGYEPSGSSDGGEGATTDRLEQQQRASAAAAHQRSAAAVALDPAPPAKTHQHTPFHPPTYPPPATPITASRLPAKTLRARSAAVGPLTPPATPSATATTTTASGTAGPTPPSSAQRVPTPSSPSSASEVERELAAAQHEGKVVYETATGRPLPLGNIVEGPPLPARGSADDEAAEGKAVGHRHKAGGVAVKQERDDAAQVAQAEKERREGLKSELGRFVAPTVAPSPQSPAQPTFLPAHLPNLAYLAPTAPTSLPLPATAVQHDLDESLGRLLSEDVFWEMLRNPLGRHRFRAYLLGYGKEEVLDLWWDAELCEQISRMVRGGATAIQDVYFDSTEGALDRLVPGASAQLVQARALDASFSTLSRAVLRGMYDTHFRAFVKRKLVEQSQVRLGGTGVEREGLGEIWCITNPRLRDNPIVLVSDAFCAMFGYTAASILGRNCRFLQGPGTSPGSVQRIRQALVAGEEHTELLLNYTSLGHPLWNLLCLVPLRARDGSVAYFVGGQIDVTGSIQSSRRLSFLIGGASSTYSAEGIPKLNTFEFSPTLVSHRPKLAQELRDFQGTGDDSNGEREISAGQARHLPPKAHIGGLSSHQRQELEGLPYESETAKAPKTILDRLKHFVSAGDKVDDQLLSPAEKSWQSAGPLQPQLDAFSTTYQRLLVLRPKGHEILYVTRALIAFLGLPIISSQDLFSCSLLHTDLLTLLDLGSREATRRARDKIRHAMRASQAVSLVVGLRVLPQSLFSLGVGKKAREGAAESLRRVALHLTPLTDRDGVTGAYVCIVS